VTVPETVELPWVSLKDEVLIDAAFMVSLKSTVIAVSTATPVAPLAGLRFVMVGGAPAWVTVWVRPAIVSVPVLAFVPVLAATVKVAVPLPVPLEVVVIQEGALLVAVQAQPPCVATVTLPDPAA
jgi:hypothetical protein